MQGLSARNGVHRTQLDRWNSDTVRSTHPTQGFRAETPVLLLHTHCWIILAIPILFTLDFREVLSRWRFQGFVHYCVDAMGHNDSHAMCICAFLPTMGEMAITLFQ